MLLIKVPNKEYLYIFLKNIQVTPQRYMLLHLPSLQNQGINLLRMNDLLSYIQRKFTC